MIARAAAALGWPAFLAAAVAASVAAPAWQFAFAGLAIGILGLPHGAGDWAVVPPARRASFLPAYLGCAATVAVLWHAQPLLALTLLLVLSAVHFAIDGDEGDGRAGRWAIGLFLVAGPAVFHSTALSSLFAAAADGVAPVTLVRMLQTLGVAAGVAALAGLARPGLDRRERSLRAAALLALLLMPPLVGFGAGFVLLHARRETGERQRALGCATLAAYLRRVLPVMAGAAAVIALLAALRFAGPALLFAAIAALATPHMLVTPLWRAAARPMTFPLRHRAA